MIDLRDFRAYLDAAVLEADAAQLADVAAELARATWRLEERRTMPAPQPSTAPPSLATAPDVAARLGVPISWVYELARTGRIPCQHLGRYRRFNLAAVEAALEAEQGRNAKPTRLGTGAKLKLGRGSEGSATAPLPRENRAGVFHG